MQIWNKYPEDAMALKFFAYSFFLINFGIKNPKDEAPVDSGATFRSFPEGIFMIVWISGGCWSTIKY